MSAKVEVEVNKLASGAASVAYSAGRYFGAVMFDDKGRYIDATANTRSGFGRNFVEGHDDLPAGVYLAAKAALKN